MNGKQVLILILVATGLIAPVRAVSGPTQDMLDSQLQLFCRQDASAYIADGIAGSYIYLHRIPEYDWVCKHLPISAKGEVRYIDPAIYKYASAGVFTYE